MLGLGKSLLRTVYTMTDRQKVLAAINSRAQNILSAFSSRVEEDGGEVENPSCLTSSLKDLITGSDSLLIDRYASPAAAYSLRKLRRDYLGPAIRVRRFVDAEELDIFFDSAGNLDTASLEAFCAGTDGYVSVWYDQANGNDAEQTTTAHQPQIVSSGTVLDIDGNSAISFDGNDELIVNHADVYGQTRLDIYMHYQSSDDTLIMFSDTSDGGRYSFVIGNSSTSTTLSGSYGSPNLYANGTQVSITSGVTTRDDLHTALITNAASTTAGTLEVHENATTSSWPNFGISDYGVTFRLIGKIAETIIFNSDQSANRTGIETNINDYYNIY
jgi:hypothetical protein